jgi:hypothetical protein
MRLFLVQKALQQSGRAFLFFLGAKLYIKFIFSFGRKIKGSAF